MNFSLSQQKASAVVPKITGLTSVCFSALIISSVLRDRVKRRKPYHRLVVGISVVDISASFWLSLSTWPIPKESGVLWAAGTDATCRLQGFFAQLGVCGSLYNASLSIYYVLVIRYGWKERQINRIEPALHAIPLFWGAMTAIAGLPLNLFGNSSLWCWITPENGIYRWCFFYVPLWLMILIVTVNCISIFTFVRRTEQAGSRHDLALRRRQLYAAPTVTLERESSISNLKIPEDHSIGLEGHQEEVGTRGPSPLEEGRRTRRTMMRAPSTMLSKRTRNVARQSFFYAGAFYLNWFALTLSRLLQTINGQTYFPLLLIAVMMVPIQGLPNFIVYLSPRFLKVRREQPTAGIFRLLHRSLTRDKVAEEITGGQSTSAYQEQPGQLPQVDA